MLSGRGEGRGTRLEGRRGNDAEAGRAGGKTIDDCGEGDMDKEDIANASMSKGQRSLRGLTLMV